MKYAHGTRRKPQEYEKDLIQYWKDNKTFEKSIEQRPEDDSYVFYDGPPFISGVPHHGTLLSSIVKDAVPRYWTMKGKRIERVWGWDCHGLPAERYSEKKLGLKSRQDVLDFGLEKYIVATRDYMHNTAEEWQQYVDRIGRWVDFEGAYKTMDKEYMESVWWAFKQLHDKGKIYEGEKVLMYCTLDGTPLSKAEVTMDSGAYQDVTDPSVYVKFKLQDEDKYLLAWTTTPWTLPSNSALAVNKDLIYVEVELDGEVFILAESLVEKALTDEKHQVLNFAKLRTFKGAELVGKSYDPLFGEVHGLDGVNAFKIWHADFVHDEEGTGIAHESPAYGEEDYELSKANNFPWVMSTDANGTFTLGPWKGMNVWEVNKQIAKEMHAKPADSSALDAAQGGAEERTEAYEEYGEVSDDSDNAAMRQEAQQVASSARKQDEPWRGSVWKIDYITHSYPHCHRCGTKLMYRAHPSWFVDIQSQKQAMLDENQNIYWFPEHIKNGRFHNTVEASPDWNISRDRFWATPLPVWKGVDKSGVEHVKVLGSFDELKDLSGVELEDYHRPWIDDVTFTIDGVLYKRVDKVMDSWFEAGSMPFAQFHYPFENKDKFEKSFPGDFIAEYIGQVRAWFYYLHAVSIGLFETHSFKNVIVTGTLAGSDGRKMSKSLGNYTDPNVLMDQYSADALRFLLLGSPVLNGEDFSLLDKDVADVHRKLGMVWNMYDFFTMYAEVDGWEWQPPKNGAAISDPSDGLHNMLDEWIVSRVHQLSADVEAAMDAYDLPGAAKSILPFIDDASNWYVRRSRRRFWKSEDDADKNNAYMTLHYVLTRLSYIMAPFTPFMADELFMKLTGRESVHLEDWLPAGKINTELVQEMTLVREIVTTGLAQRSVHKLKVRQPLAAVNVVTNTTLSDESKSIICEELNVKRVSLTAGDEMSVELDTEITTELAQEGAAREIIRRIQELRKDSGLDVDDRIELSIETTKHGDAVRVHTELIMHETLAKNMTSDLTGNEKKFVLDDDEVRIVIAKVLAD